MIEERIEHPGAWTAPTVRKEDIVFELGERHLAAVAAAIEGARARGLALYDVDREQFPLEAIGEDLAAIKRELDEGRGIVVVRGFPIGEWPAEDVELMYWGFGLHLGTAVSQSVLGDRIGHVVDVTDEDPNARAYRSKRELSLHNDLGNYHAMLCLSQPVSGGESRYASTLSVHNVMVEEAPEHLPRLYRGYSLYRLGEEQPGELPYTPYRVPVFSVKDGYLSSRLMRGFIEAAATLSGEPLEGADIAALDRFEEIAHRDELMLEFRLEPGEAVFYNNLFIMHARAAFEDDKPKGRRRHLLRMWLYAEGARPTVPEIELFDYPGIMPQPGRSPSGEGERLRSLGAKQFSRATLRR